MFSTQQVESAADLMWTTRLERYAASVSGCGCFLSSSLSGFPHATWKAVGVWCGQVAASPARQAFQGVVNFCSRPPAALRWRFRSRSAQRSCSCTPS